MADQTPSSVFDGYYEGATEEGDQLLFLIPSQSPVVTRFQAILSFVQKRLESDFEDEHDLRAKDVPLAEDGSFSYWAESVGHDLLWFGLKGLLLPNGEATGSCLGVLYGPTIHGSSGWRKWTAVRNDEVEVSAESFLWRLSGD